VEAPSGARVTLRRVAADAEGAAYVGDVEISGSRWKLEARVGKNGDVSMERDAEVPNWLFDFTRSALRAAFRSAGRVEGMPRRISRWRAGPAAGVD
jgi:hypothetical protein